MKTLTINTPVGTFTRKTNTNYTHIVVRNSPRAMQVLEESKTQKMRCSVDKRWVKDHGYAVTYHTSYRAAVNAAKSPYTWDGKTTVAGIYEVAA
jgi:hypothetical protein